MITSALVFSAGLVLVIAGAEVLIRGATQLAERIGLSPLVVGLTVVAFGTSAPELAVSIKGAVGGQASLALGNVVGSNIFNVLFILGLSALVMPLVVSRPLVRLDVPLMIGASVLVLGLALDGTISRVDGGLLCMLLLVYTGFQIYQGRKGRGETGEENAADTSLTASKTSPQPTASGQIPNAGLLNAGLLAIGLTLLVFGSRWMVNGAVNIARALGVSDLSMGLTIIAAGTSLPELVTSVMASARGQRDIAVGNVVGSNVFNLTGVLGISSLIAPAGIAVLPAVVGFDLPVMVVVALACLPVFFTGGVISRWEGAMLLVYYGAYTTYLLLAATQHDALPLFNTAILYFALPLTAVTLLVLVWQTRKRLPPT